MKWDSSICLQDNKSSLYFYPVHIFKAEILSTYYICCIYSNSLKNTFTMESNSMNPDQTAPKGAVWSGPILFAL